MSLLLLFHGVAQAEELIKTPLWPIGEQVVGGRGYVESRLAVLRADGLVSALVVGRDGCLESGPSRVKATGSVATVLRGEAVGRVGILSGTGQIQWRGRLLIEMSRSHVLASGMVLPAREEDDDALVLGWME